MGIILPTFRLDEKFDAVVAPDLAVPRLGVGGELVHLRLETDDVEDDGSCVTADESDCGGGRHGIACDGGQTAE